MMLMNLESSISGRWSLNHGIDLDSGMAFLLASIHATDVVDILLIL